MRGRVVLFSFLFCVVNSFCNNTPKTGKQSWNTRGLSPEALKQYNDHIIFDRPDSSPVFRCFDGSRQIPLNYINDDYCDCSDGSDEPGTSACVSRRSDAKEYQTASQFYCENLHHKPQYIPKWKVDDGICDCCDGSDEQRRPETQCHNTCKELGDLWKEKQRQLQLVYEKGKKINDALLAKAQKLINSWKVAEAALRSHRIPQLQTRLSALEELYEKEKAKKKVLEAQEKEKRAAHSDGAGSTSENVNLDSGRTLDGQLDSQDPSDDEPVNIQQIKETPTLLPTQVPVEHAAENSDTLLSEHAQWMHREQEIVSQDGNEQSLKAPLVKISTIPPKFRLSFIKLLVSQWKVHPRFFWKQVSRNVLNFFVPKEKSSHERTPDLQTEVETLSEELDKLKKEQKDLAYKLETAQHGPHMLAFIAMENPCVKTTADKYTYEICFLQKATQTGDNSPTRLGDYVETKQERDAIIMDFRNGDVCWNGPSRSLKATIRCGVETRFVEVAETERCTYTAALESPAACLVTAGIPEGVFEDISFKDEL